MRYTLLLEQDVAIPTRDGGTICANVFSLPRKATFTLERAPICAIHSRNALTLISRPTITEAVTARRTPCQPPGWDCTSRNSVTATMSLSATGSRNAPKAEVRFMRRARRIISSARSGPNLRRV